MFLHYICLTSSIHNYLYFSLVIGVLKVKLVIVLEFEPSMMINASLIYVVSYYDKNLHQVHLTYLCVAYASPLFIAGVTISVVQHRLGLH